jgi:hypothetical protein
MSIGFYTEAYAMSLVRVALALIRAWRDAGVQVVMDPGWSVAAPGDMAEELYEAAAMGARAAAPEVCVSWCARPRQPAGSYKRVVQYVAAGHVAEYGAEEMALLHAADAVAVPSAWSQRNLGLGEVVAHGVDAAVFQPPTGKAPKRTFTVLNVSSGAPAKRLDLVVDAFCRAFQDQDARLLLCLPPGMVRYGNTSLPSDLVPMAAGDPRVQALVGLYDEAGMAAIYRQADCYLTMSDVETFGLTALEAMACGLPVVMAANGALAELSGDHAVSVRDPAEAADALRKVRGDTTFRRGLQTKARSYAAGRDWKAPAAKLLALAEGAAAG